MAKNLIVDNELVLYGDVGDMWGDGSGFTAQQVLEAMPQMSGKNEITVRLNSGGGAVFEGMAIYNALKAFPGKVNMHIDGIAASAASVIAMSGDEIQMGGGALMMIHDPSGFTWGTAADHTKNAEVLNKIGEQAALIYAEKTGMSANEVRAMMLTETWLDGEEAVEFKFATSKQDGEAASMAVPKFDYTMYKSVPAHIAARGQRTQPGAKRPSVTQGEATMTTATAETKPVVTPAAPVVDVSKELMTRGAAAKLSMDKILEVITAAAGDLSKGKDLLLDAVAARDPSPEHRPSVTVTADARDKFKSGATLALMARAGMQEKGKPLGERNEFSGMTLRELARHTLELAGDKTRYTDPMQMIGAAFNPTMFSGGHSTSDFTEILGNTANKAMLIGYDEIEETFPIWTGVGSLPDFKTQKRVDLGLFPSLAEVAEGAEYHYATVSERAMSLSLATYGKMFSITRQAIINDDLSAFTKIPNRMGRAAKRTIGNLVYAQLTGNVTLDDSVALFHSSHANYTSSGTAISVTSLGVARTMMGKQTDPDSIATGGLNIRPAFFLVPLELEDTAKVHMSAQYDPTASTAFGKPNPIANMAQVVPEARLSTASATAWYLVAAPRAIDTLDVLYLNGVQTPMMEQRPGWNVDGVEFKVRIDAGVKTFDHRGFYKNVGA